MREYVTFEVSNQLFGISVTKVQEVLTQQKITKVPLSHKSITGLLNLRGQIVTALDLRSRMQVSSEAKAEQSMSIIVCDENELFSLLADSVGDVIGVDETQLCEIPPTLDKVWRECSESVYRLPDKIMIILDVKKILNLKDKNVKNEGESDERSTRAA